MSEWATERLAKVLTLAKAGGTPSTSNDRHYGGAIPFMTIEDITNSQKWVTQTKKSLSEDGLRSCSAWLVEKGDLLYSMYATLGKVRLAGLPLCTNQAIIALRPDSRKVLPQYLYYYLEHLEPEITRLAGQTTQANLNAQIVKSLPIQYPVQLAEQRRIADLLSAVDEQISLFEAEAAKESARALALTQAVLPAGFSVENPPTSRLADALLGIEVGKSFTCSDTPAPEGMWGVLKVSAVRPEGFVSSENKQVDNLALVNPRYEVADGDLLMTRANTPELVGAASHVVAPQRRLLLCDKTLRLRPKPEVLPQYLWLWLQTPVARRHVEAHATGTSAGMKNISQAAIRSLPLTMPSPSEQAALVRPIVALYEHIHCLRTSASKLRRLKSGLSARLLSPGEGYDK